MNYDSDQKTMDKYLVKSQINFPGLKQAETEKNFLATIFTVAGLPSMVLADADGKVVMSGVGGETSKVIAKMKELSK